MGIWKIRMNFITKIDYSADHTKMLEDLEEILKIRPWPSEDFVRKSSGNQIGITHRPGAVDPWLDADGSLVTVVMNQTDQKITYNYCIGGAPAVIMILPHAIQTLVL
jgi:hypothetical protein